MVYRGQQTPAVAVAGQTDQALTQMVETAALVL
jgi:hypothetical protein